MESAQGVLAPVALEILLGDPKEGRGPIAPGVVYGDGKRRHTLCGRNEPLGVRRKRRVADDAENVEAIGLQGLFGQFQLGRVPARNHHRIAALRETAGDRRAKTLRRANPDHEQAALASSIFSYGLAHDEPPLAPRSAVEDGARHLRDRRHHLTAQVGLGRFQLLARAGLSPTCDGDPGNLGPSPAEFGAHGVDVFSAIDPA